MRIATGLSHRLLRLALVGTALLGAPAFADPIEREGTPEIRPKLKNEKERNNLSGAACARAPALRDACLMIGDEKLYARFFTLTPTTLAPGAKLFLLPEALGETDAEGIAYGDDHYYVIGSHSRNKDGVEERSRHFLYRIRIDPQAPHPDDIGTSAAPSPAVEKVSLDRIIAAHPLLRRHLAQAPGEGAHGVNIEGLAYRDRTLFIGFRGPVDEGGALILAISAEDAFAGGTGPVESYRVKLGEGQGVRDLAAVGDGILILSGPEMRGVPPKPHLFLWRPGTDPVDLGTLAMKEPKDGPEALVLLDETPQSYRVLVLSDGDAGGDPTIFRVKKP